MEHDEFKDEFKDDYLPSPEEHARECWEWFRDMIDDVQSSAGKGYS
jgi:hypothetical protein